MERNRKEGERSSCWCLFIYRTEDAGSITMLAVLVCARRKRALDRSAFFKPSKSRYTGAIRIRYEYLGLDPDGGGSQTPILW